MRRRIIQALGARRLFIGVFTFSLRQQGAGNQAAVNREKKIRSAGDHPFGNRADFGRSGTRLCSTPNKDALLGSEDCSGNCSDYLLRWIGVGW